MSWLYILQNKETDRYYIGSTTDIERRIKQHKSGNTRTTRILKTFDLVYTEEFKTIEEARIREKYIKSQKSKKFIKNIVRACS